MCQTPSVKRVYARSAMSRWQPDQSENLSLKMPKRSTSVYTPNTNSNTIGKLAPLKKGFQNDTGYNVALSGEKKSDTDDDKIWCFQTPKISNRKTFRTGASKKHEATGESMSNTVDEACLDSNVSNDEQSVETRNVSCTAIAIDKCGKSNSIKTITSTKEIAKNDLTVRSAEHCRGHRRNRRRFLVNIMTTASSSSKRFLRRLQQKSMKHMHSEVTTAKHLC